jgi:hypothetical protein
MLVRSSAPDYWTERGLGSGLEFVTFHPDFAKNGRFYTVHTEAGSALTTKAPHLLPEPYPCARRAD